MLIINKESAIKKRIFDSDIVNITVFIFILNKVVIKFYFSNSLAILFSISYFILSLQKISLMFGFNSLNFKSKGYNLI